MTCIVALEAGGKVFMGADSAGVSNLDLQVRADRKVFRNGDFLFGFTSSFRMGQLLRHSLQPPKRHPDKDLTAFLITDFVNAVRDCLKAGGFAAKDKEVEMAGAFLLGHAGRIFGISSDYQVIETVAKYQACGCGEAYALGALYANGRLEPEERVRVALEAAAANSAGVRGPFYIETI